MKRKGVLFVMLIIIISLTACTKSSVNPAKTSSGNGMMMKLELDKDYDNVYPLVNEQLFCVSKDIDVLQAEGSIQFDGKSVVLEVKNNKTLEVLWSHTWAKNENAETFTISLENVKKDEEYVISFSGSEIIQAAVEIMFAGNLVQERAKPLS